MSQTHIKLNFVTIIVKNLGRMQHFYTEKIGLSVIREQDSIIELGVDGRTLVVLKEEPLRELNSGRYTGLFHLALLLPDERDLGDMIEHLISSNVTIDGASDHDFSQALYLSDPEGNGIEIYADRPRDEWHIFEDGSIYSTTEAMDAQRLMQIRYNNPWTGIPSGTVLGHVHLRVNDVEQAREFYLNVLGFELKTELPHALFVSHDGYHHDLGLNAWLGKIDTMPDNLTGLDALHLKSDTFEEIQSRLEKHKISHTGDDATITVVDPAGIKLIIHAIH